MLPKPKKVASFFILIAGTLQSIGCRYRIYESSHAASCLSGAWCRGEEPVILETHRQQWINTVQ